jgi:hypothetical protein
MKRTRCWLYLGFGLILVYLSLLSNLLYDTLDTMRFPWGLHPVPVLLARDFVFFIPATSAVCIALFIASWFWQVLSSPKVIAFVTFGVVGIVSWFCLLLEIVILIEH